MKTTVTRPVPAPALPLTIPCMLAAPGGAVVLVTALHLSGRSHEDRTVQNYLPDTAPQMPLYANTDDLQFSGVCIHAGGAWHVGEVAQREFAEGWNRFTYRVELDGGAE